MDIKPIETVYKGYRFRSRLEARWAVFFDALGIKWEYEPEGFDLGNGIYYLPDFKIHNAVIEHGVHAEGVTVYIEVKGIMSNADADKVRKFYEVGTNGDKVSDTPIFVVGSIPDGADLQEIDLSVADKWETNELFYSFGTIDGDYWIPATPAVDNNGRFLIYGHDSNYMSNINEDKTVNAFNSARQARFEHGETPSTVISPKSLQKENNLLGIELTKRAIRDIGYAIVIDNYADVLSLYKDGVQNICACGGKALTLKQAKTLKAHTNRVVLCCNEENILKDIDVLRGTGLDVKVLIVDPAVYVRNYSADDFRNLIKKYAVTDVEYKVQLVKNKYDTHDTAQGIRFMQEVASILRELSPVEADIYIIKISRQEKISEGALRREVNYRHDRPRRYEQRTETKESAGVKSSVLMEKTMIRLTIANSEHYTELKEYSEVIVTDNGKRIFDVMGKLYNECGQIDVEQLKDNLIDDDLIYLNSLTEEIHVGAKDNQAFDECIAKLKKQRKDKRKKEIQDILEEADEDTDRELLAGLLKEYLELQK